MSEPRRWTLEGVVYKHMPDHYEATVVVGPQLSLGAAPVEVVEAAPVEAELAELRELVELLSKGWDTEVQDANRARAIRCRIEDALEQFEALDYRKRRAVSSDSLAESLRAALEASE